MSSVLNRIRDTLNTLSSDADVPMEGVWYGACREKELKYWNYFEYFEFQYLCLFLKYLITNYTFHQ